MSSPFANELVERTPQWANFVDLDEMKSYMQWPATDTTRDQALQDVIDAACYWVQDYLGRPVGPTTFFRRFDGWSGYSGAYLNLPYAPILTVPIVIEWWGSNGPHALSLQTPENQAGGVQCFQLDALHGRITRTFAGLIARPFFPGLQNIEVEFVAGYNPVPPTLRYAAKELIKYWWVNSQQASRSFTPKGSDYGGDIDPHNALWPGVPNRLMAFLAPFEQVGLG